MIDGDASMTARRVAAYRMSFPRNPAPYGSPDADDRLQRAVAAGVDVSGSMGPYLRRRTAFFDDAVVDAIAAGIDQVVAVGAGYDGRSLRYAAPGVQWFELDHPDTQVDKRARLDRLGLATTGIAFVPADFGEDDVGAALADAGHRTDRPSLLTCEGVAGYLPAPVLRRLLAALADRSAAGSMLAITLAIEPDSPVDADRRARLDAAVSGLGEPLSDAFVRDQVAAALAATGWTVNRAVDPAGVPLATSTRASAFVLAHR